jgi:hypothetical protein
MARTFKLTLGPKSPCSHELRHSKDRAQEVLVDFSDGTGAHACFISSAHNMHGKRPIWCVFDEHGDTPRGLARGVYATRKGALKALSRWVESITGLRNP